MASEDDSTSIDMPLLKDYVHASILETGNQRQPQETDTVQKIDFKKKICVRFLPLKQDLEAFSVCCQADGAHEYQDQRKDIRCKCGLPYKGHDHAAIKENGGLRKCVKDLFDVLDTGEITNLLDTCIKELYKKNGELRGEYEWNPDDKWTIKQVDGADMGNIKFHLRDRGISESCFTRLSNETDMPELYNFLANQWKLFEADPKLVISIIGTTSSTNLTEKLVENVMTISRHVSLLIFTSGLETDNVAKKIGDAVIKAQGGTIERDTEKSKAKIKCVGITTWATVKDELETQIQSRDTYQIKANAWRPGYSFVLNPGHSHFLLVDNGMTCRFPRELNTFWANLQKAVKDKGFNMLNLILGNDSEEGTRLEMTRTLIKKHLPVTFLKHARKYIDILTDDIMLLREGVIWTSESVLKPSESLANEIKQFLEEQVLEDARGQHKNVLTICDLLSGESKNPNIENSLEASCLRILTLPLSVKARENNREPTKEKVLEIVKLASLLRYWGASMEDLLAHNYDWTEDEQNTLKDTFKNCLLQDHPEAFTVFDHVHCCDMQRFLSINMLEGLYSEYLVTDILQAVCVRERLLKQSTDHSPKGIKYIFQEIIDKLLLPDCFVPETEGNDLKYPFKEVMIWAVLSRKWKLVHYILYNQENDIIVWFLATALLCKAVAYSQKDPEIRTVFKDKQHAYEHAGKRLLEILTAQHGNLAVGCETESMSVQTHQSLDRKSKMWYGLCPAELALLGNFQSFVKSEPFHNYIFMRWNPKNNATDKVKKRKLKVQTCFEFCAQPPRFKFYTHFVSYMLMILVFCSSVVSKVHYYHQSWLISWIFCYEIGEAITRFKQQTHVRICSKKQRVLSFVRNYLHLLLLFLFLTGGFVCICLGFDPWGEMLYGLACVILIAFIFVHFMSSFRVFAQQISILQRVIKEIVSFLILIILLLWSGSMVFHAALCLEERIDSVKNANGGQTNVAEIASGGWANTLHVAWLLYLSLYGDYSFEITENGHLACVEDNRALRWVSYVLIGLHILIGNVLLMNLFISAISTKSDDLKRHLGYVWKTNWYMLTLHYEKQTIFPPPFNIVELLVRLVCYCKRQCNKKGASPGGTDQTDGGQSDGRRSNQSDRNIQLYQQEALKTLRQEQAGRTN